MLIYYNKLLTVKAIKNILKIRGCKFYNTLNKASLLSLLNFNGAATKIQRVLRSKIMRYENCPISCDRLKYPFISFRFDGKFFYYDFKTLVDYFIKTNVFKDPLTRNDISDENIIYINTLIKYYRGSNSNKILITNSMAKNAELIIIVYCLYYMTKELNRKKNLNINEIYSNILPRVIYYIYTLKNNYTSNEVNVILNAFIHNIDSKISNITVIIDYVNSNIT